jgi:uncharacterized protein
MKFLLLIAVVLLVLWLWRGSRDDGRPGAGTSRRGPAQPPQQQEMIQCPVCLVHLPRSDALPGPDGQLYCCAEHRARGSA